MTGETIPFTAWEQAVFVALFIVLVVSLLAWFSKQQGAWQSFIQKRDEQWQAWMKDTNCQTTEAMERVSASLDRLAEKIDQHDDKVDDRIKSAVSEIKGTKGKKNA